MRRRSNRRDAMDPAEVAMSPLIDCVFLLLIFFLVTTMLKRKEKQIPVNMPDSTASVASVTWEKQLLIGLTKDGAILSPSGKNEDGGVIWESVDDLSVFLKNYIASRGSEVLTMPLQINAHREVSFQAAIDAIDICKLQGFSNVSVKTRQQGGDN